ncbi:LysR family transcriptional regulator [Parasedimentitalea marina]|uniref:LysR family transcriptional regulator n=1 Tax=Parasedimentitalea marina TaxID=2483033 RepID=A0A3T0N7E2_9RHOB|nr:LysR family transcriptional regulator [Parasedimentitalea marina]AZV79891.1 LysR family transcriptional regulator [Parasedimentitalea marina]
MLNLKPIRVFLEIASLQSFTAASQSLRMTPATVTRIIARLEEDLGQQLLLRTTRRVSLTSAGALVAARYRPLIEEFDRIKEELERETHPHRGRLIISAPLSFGIGLMPRLVNSFQLAYPNIELVISMTDRFVDIFEENCDLAIRLSEPLTDKTGIWRKICEIPRHVVASKVFFETNPRPDSPENLDRKNCLSYGHNKEAETWKLRNGAMRRKVTAGSSLISNNGNFLYSMIMADTGIAVLPEFIVSQGLKNGSIEHVLPDWTAEPLWLSLYYPPYEAFPPLVATFTDFFEAFLADLDGFDFSDV